MAGERLGILISDGGTTMAEVVRACQTGVVDMTAACIISSKPDVGGIDKAMALGFTPDINLFTVDPRNYRENGRLNTTEFGRALLGRLKRCNIDFVSQNGWLPYTPDNVIAEYSGRIVNQHPGPLEPDHKDSLGRRLDFGGVGMYGARVSCAILTYNLLSEAKVIPTEATVHHVVAEPDGGAVVRATPFFQPKFL